MRHSDVGNQQSQVVVDFSNRTNRRPRVGCRRLLLDGDRRRQAVDQVDIRFLHLLQKLASIGGERLDVSALALRVDRVKREGRLTGTGEASDHHQSVTRKIDVNVLQIVNAGTPHSDPVVSHAVQPFPGIMVETPMIPEPSTAARRHAGLRFNRPLRNDSQVAPTATGTLDQQRAQV